MLKLKTMNQQQKTNEFDNKTTFVAMNLKTKQPLDFLNKLPGNSTQCFLQLNSCHVLSKKIENLRFRDVSQKLDFMFDFM